MKVSLALMPSYHPKELDNAFEEYLRVKKIQKKFKERTIKDHKTHFEYFKRYLHQTGQNITFVHEVDDDVCIRYWEYMYDKVKWDDHIHIGENLNEKKIGLSQTTINLRTRSLKAQFNYYVKKGYTDRNPWQDFNISNLDAIPRYWSKAELLRFFEAIDVNTFEGERDRALFTFLLETGTRIGECLKLNEWDFDLESRKVHFPAEITKNGSPHTSFLKKDMTTMMKRLFKKNQDIKRNSLGGVFISSSGSRLKYAGVRDALLKYAKKANIPDAHLHQFRHSFAVHYLLDGGEQASLKKIGGWKTLDALKIYQELKDDEAKQQHQKYSPTNKLFD
ncbi:tyrosine-type recombinase/integrase [Mesobacillus maritimus]|uniref:tyrosine-type recombinase/integrase n=1 Tax=Mesobacillus maritimus TaxID=1643336 RepID=UPI00384C410B